MQTFITLIAVLSIVAPAATYAVTTDIGTVLVSPTATSVVSVTVSGVVGKAFVLDASKSTDDGVIGTFSWRQVGGPVVKILNSNTPEASVVPTQAGTYVFDLYVSNATGMSKLVQKTSVIVSSSTSTTGGSSSSGSTGGTVSVPPQEASDMFIKIEPIEGESSEPKKGNVEMNWKVEEGESAPAIEPDEIDVAGDGEPTTPDFGILLGGGGGDDNAEQNVPAATEEGRAEVAKLILADLKERGVPVQSVLIRETAVETTVTQRVKLFAIIPINTTATVAIDANENVKVKFPWWAFLASGKDKDGIGERTFTAISNILKTKHDTVKNSIGNIR